MYLSTDLRMYEQNNRSINAFVHFQNAFTMQTEFRIHFSTFRFLIPNLQICGGCNAPAQPFVCDQRRICSSSRAHQIKMTPFRNWMESFQTDSEIGFQFLPSDKLSPVANYSHCQLTLQPGPSEDPQQSACQICFCLSRRRG